MNEQRHVKLFKNGRNQAVRIPREFELPGEDALMHKEGDRLIIEPANVKKMSLIELMRSFGPSSDDDILEIDDLPAEPVEI